MNTLPKGITRSLYRSEDGYEALRRHWSRLVNAKAVGVRSPHYLLYLVMQGKDWRRGFAPMTNARKLENGNIHEWGAVLALRAIHSPWYQERLLGPFAGVIDAATLEAVRKLLPTDTKHYATRAYEVKEVACAA